MILILVYLVWSQFKSTWGNPNLGQLGVSPIWVRFGLSQVWSTLGDLHMVNIVGKSLEYWTFLWHLNKTDLKRRSDFVVTTCYSIYPNLPLVGLSEVNTGEEQTLVKLVCQRFWMFSTLFWPFLYLLLFILLCLFISWFIITWLFMVWAKVSDSIGGTSHNTTCTLKNFNV